MPSRKQLVSIMLAISLMINPFAVILDGPSAALSLNEQHEEEIPMHAKEQLRVSILYDFNDEVCRMTANRLYQELRQAKLLLTMHPIMNKDSLPQMLKGSWMNIYVFHGTEEGLCIDSQTIPWSTLSLSLERSQVDHHLFASCHSEVLQAILADSISVHGLNDALDTEVALLGVFCTIYEILNASLVPVERALAGTMLGIAASYFLSNLQTIVERAFDPKETLDGFYIDYKSNETDSRGPWGWIVDIFKAIILLGQLFNNDWVSSNSTHVNFDQDKVNGGSTDSGSMKMEDMGSGDSSTGEFPFDIPLEFDLDPRIGSGPWYMPEYVDLVFTIQAKDGKLDLAEVLGLKQILKAAGYDVSIELTPKLSATLRVGNFIEQMASANPAIDEDPFEFMGGSFSIELGFQLGIPLATFLDYLVPGTGKTVTTIMDLLNMKVNLVNYMGLVLGMSYNATSEASQQDVGLKVGFGLDISISLPSPASYIKDAIGISLPLDFITLGAEVRAKTGIFAKASFGHKGDSFTVGLFYYLFFKFYASLFWIFKFDITKEWKDEIPFIEIQSEGSSNPPTNDHAKLDLDGDGLCDELERAMGLDPKVADTDNDLLSDGNELLMYFTDPLVNDSDSDGLLDYEELALWYAAGLDPMADYDKDGKPCLLDSDSDNDGLTDKWELKGMYSPYWKGVIKTNPSLTDTDFDGFSDLEEWDFAGPALEQPHPDPRERDSDSDGLWDRFEYEWYQNQYARMWPVLEILEDDEDGDGLLDGEEYLYLTSPIDIDTDGDFDLDEDNFINTTERNLAINNGYYGDFTDYGEVNGNTWSQWPFGLDDCVPPNPTPTNPLSADTDRDGATDVFEYTAGTLPVTEDSDGDGLENSLDKFFFHANCTDPDNDKDGIRDGDEVNYFNLTRGISNETITALYYLDDPDVDDDGLLDGLELLIGTDPLDNDTDNDFLLDGEEVEIGSYPLIPDSDGDSLLDGIEVHQYGTDPLRQDTDNDALSDDIEVAEQHLYILYQGEVAYFTDPDDPDSDDDGLTDGEEYYGWNWAVNRKVAPGASVIQEPLIMEDDEFILRQLFNAPDPYRARFQTHPMNADTDFDGLIDGLEKEIVLSPLSNDTDADGWTDFGEIDFMMNRFSDSWENVPDIWHYLDYDGDGVTDLTEFESGTDMLMPDTDMDGLDDWTELFVPCSVKTEEFELDDLEAGLVVNANTTLPENERYTNATLFDTDFDGLNDTYEILSGTDPTNPDSDQDGLSDYQELMVYYAYEGFMILERVSLDPLSNDTDADGISDLDEVIICGTRMNASSNPEHGPLGDFDNDGIINILDYDSDNDGIYDGFEVGAYQDSSLSWYPLGTDLFDDDQDSDTFPDGMFTDYDQDGLSDYLELTMAIPGYTYGSIGDENTTARNYGHLINHTLVAIEDTDGDGYNDGWEVNFGSDPLNRGSFPQIFRWEIPTYGFNVDFRTTSEVENLLFDAENGRIEFDVSGPDGTLGFCNITIPRDLLFAPEDEWQVLLDEMQVAYEVVTNDTVTFIYFSYMHSAHHVVIQGSEVLGPPAPDPVILIVIGGVVGVIVVVLLLVMMKKRKA